MQRWRFSARAAAVMTSQHEPSGMSVNARASSAWSITIEDGRTTLRRQKTLRESDTGRLRWKPQTCRHSSALEASKVAFLLMSLTLVSQRLTDAAMIQYS